MDKFKLSKVQQEKAIGEGLAVGMLALGIESVSSNKVSVDLDFRHAWRAWAYSNQFPQVHASAFRDDITRIIHSSSRRQGPLAAWTSDSTHRPYVCIEGWTFEDVAEVLESSTGVSLEAWKDLARRFTANG